jgi:MFS family permease
MAYEQVHEHEYPKYVALISAVSALGSLIGPLIGGAFSEDVTWRWIFLIKYVHLQISDLL